MVTIEEMREYLAALIADLRARANPNLPQETLDLTVDARGYYAQCAEMFVAIDAELAKR